MTTKAEKAIRDPIDAPKTCVRKVAFLVAMEVSQRTMAEERKRERPSSSGLVTRRGEEKRFRLSTVCTQLTSAIPTWGRRMRNRVPTSDSEPTGVVALERRDDIPTALIGGGRGCKKILSFTFVSDAHARSPKRGLGNVLDVNDPLLVRVPACHGVHPVAVGEEAPVASGEEHQRLVGSKLGHAPHENVGELTDQLVGRDEVLFLVEAEAPRLNVRAEVDGDVARSGGEEVGEVGAGGGGHVGCVGVGGCGQEGGGVILSEEESGGGKKFWGGGGEGAEEGLQTAQMSLRLIADTLNETSNTTTCEASLHSILEHVRFRGGGASKLAVAGALMGSQVPAAAAFPALTKFQTPVDDNLRKLTGEEAFKTPQQTQWGSDAAATTSLNFDEQRQMDLLNSVRHLEVAKEPRPFTYKIGDDIEHRRVFNSRAFVRMCKKASQEGEGMTVNGVYFDHPQVQRFAGILLPKELINAARAAATLSHQDRGRIQRRAVFLLNYFGAFGMQVVEFDDLRFYSFFADKFQFLDDYLPDNMAFKLDTRMTQTMEEYRTSKKAHQITQIANQLRLNYVADMKQEPKPSDDDLERKYNKDATKLESLLSSEFEEARVPPASATQQKRGGG